MNEEDPKPKKLGVRTPLDPDQPAPRTRALAAAKGEELTAEALRAWQARVHGTPIVDIAYGMGLTIESARDLIEEAHAAIAEDLKENVNLNRQLDLDRIDGLLSNYYPAAVSGHHKSADVVLKLLAHRSKLTGVEPMPEPGRSQPQNVLLWIQNCLPSINQIVDALPPD
jgi:hypothetical protein